MAAIVFASVFTGSPAGAQDPLPFTRPLTPDAPTEQGRFGAAVAHGNRVLIVGAPGDSLRGTEAGSVFVFDRDGTTGTYTSTQQLMPPELLPFDRFGETVAIFGNVLAVGAVGDDSAAPNSGAVYVFVRDGSGLPFQMVAKLVAPAGLAGSGDRFGAAVSVFLDRVAVGAPQMDAVAFESGAVFVFDVDQTSLQVQPASILTDPAGRAGDGLGCSVAVGLERVAAGAERFDPPGGPFHAGGVLFFEDDASMAWPLSETLVSTRPETGAEFGASIALESPRSIIPGTLVVGEPMAARPGETTPRGVVHVFEASVGGLWNHVFDHGIDDLRSGTMRGTAVSAQSGFALVSAPGRSGGRGGIDILRRTPNGDWEFVREVTLPGSAIEDRAGIGLTYRNNIPVIGAPGLDGGVGVDQGIVWTSSALWADVGEARCAPAVPNSTGTFASIAGRGSAKVSNNTFTLQGEHLQPFNFVLPLAATDSGFVPGAGGSLGNLCLGGSIGRFLGSIQIVDPTGQVEVPVDLSLVPQPSGLVQVSPGETWHFQLWFRDSVLGASSNYTSALEVNFE